MRVVVIGGWAPSLVRFRGPLLAAMVARGHDVIAMAADGSDVVTRQLAELGVRFEPIALARTGIDPIEDTRAFAALVRTLRAHRPDLVFGYTIKPIVYGSLAASVAGVPWRAAMITGLGYALATPRTAKQRAVAVVARSLYRAALARCQAVFVQNADDLAELRARHVLASTAPVTMVRGSGVDLEHYAKAPLPDGDPTFLFLGRLLHDKGIGEYVAAAARVRERHPQARFRVVGWLDSNPECVRRDELDRWCAAGLIDYRGPTEDVRPHLRDAHVVVLPSYREGTPRSVLEAMSTGRAVITTDAPGCRDTIVDGVSGLLVPVRDPGALARAALRLVESRALVERLAAGARARVESLYDARQVASQMLETMGL
ncbi:MAG TPA: glycosyltransferase family 4 protein [Acidimicrobiia bacterium]|jgi:glycosyltransferase involved in cell wall biosynthesis|nr:glycosyltransferase family 4 protein [Acidimicrobiia bacterium]